MALDDIFRALDEQGDKEIEEILSAARAQGDAIGAEAAEEADSIRRQRIEQVEKSVRAASAQRLNSVRLENKKRIAAIKEAAVGTAFDEAGAALSAIRSSPGYDEMFRALLTEAADGAGPDLMLEVDPADEKLAGRLLADLGIAGAVTSGSATVGGVVVSTDGGRMIRRNTLEDRLAKLRSIAQADVAGILFS